MPEGLGYHIIADFYGCESSLLDNVKLIRRVLRDAVVNANMKAIGEVFKKFTPYGVTGIIALEESHISIHTWPEYGFASVDIFTCGEKSKPHVALELIKLVLKPARMKVREIERGTLTKVIKL
ncbi:MAG: adenosylmethionine decarboxylase [Nitrososphaeria archaeon]